MSTDITAASFPTHANDASALVRPSVSGNWLFLGVVGVPPAIFYMGLSSSEALGMVIFSLALLWRFGSGAPLGSRASAIDNRQILQTIVLIYFFILLHLGAASTAMPIDAMRAVASLIPLALMIAAGGALAKAILDIPPDRLDRDLLAAYGAMCVIALVGGIGFGPPTLGAEAWRRPAFPFTEPSHFALAFIPVFMYACVRTRGRTYLLVLSSGLAVSALQTSLTLAVGLVLVAGVSLRLGKLLLLAVPVVLALSLIDLTYFTERLDFSGDTSNLSGLIYLQGWQMIEESLQRSQGWGLGFQQLGVHGTEVSAAQLIRALRQGEDSNTLDGGFTFVKLAGEMGAFGILLALFMAVLAARSAFILRRVADGRQTMDPAELMARCVVVSFMVELLVRSAGYFGGTPILMVAALWLIQRWKYIQSQ